MVAEVDHEDDDTKAHQGGNDGGSKGCLVMVGQIDYRVWCIGAGGEPK
jgi:hypothetical protein